MHETPHECRLLCYVAVLRDPTASLAPFDMTPHKILLVLPLTMFINQYRLADQKMKSVV